ncbi:FecCD family ABC transporter permease [Paenibacillus arenosi]|uniref:Iron chelate uptake ABC transporter family permease subunit n=1 Tax=Paenibacillus arenosi TaxID=2774142 RepID=A0ABR9AV85_9BACL|nr:iron chelate uptake ABC transporter family permease subunit [Paenibacillus arenosi]MBD8498043.1 iron chelate uptake ABC transporter family permease subunit [Paenibacillus arenosi]
MSKRTISDKPAHQKTIVVFSLCAALLIIAVISLAVGAVFIPLDQVVLTLFGQHTEGSFIVEKYRAPRVVLSLLVGAGLAISGSILQGVLRNPLASPDVIGITKGAGLAASITIILLPAAPIIALPIAAFTGAAIVAVLLFIFVYKRGAKPTTLALTGIALGAMCDAGIQYLMVKHPVDVNAALIWLTGSVWGRGWDDVMTVLPWLLLLIPLAFTTARKLDVLSLGDEMAAGLGEHVQRLRLMLVAIAVALAGASVAVVGSIGFVGLIAPHIARQLVGAKHDVLLPVSALIGAILVMSADTLGRAILPPVELPAGLITAAIGAPYFLYLLRRQRRVR